MLRPSLPQAIDFAELSLRRITIAGSTIGSIEETQEVLVEGEVRFRCVIDNATL